FVEHEIETLKAILAIVVGWGVRLRIPVLEVDAFLMTGFADVAHRPIEGASVDERPHADDLQAHVARNVQDVGDGIVLLVHQVVIVGPSEAEGLAVLDEVRGRLTGALHLQKLEAVLHFHVLDLLGLGRLGRFDRLERAAGCEDRKSRSESHPGAKRCPYRGPTTEGASELGSRRKTPEGEYDGGAIP